MGAYGHVRVLSIDIGPRPSGSENCRIGAEYILNQLEHLAIDAELQEFKLRPYFWTGTALLGVLFALAIYLTYYAYPVPSFLLSVIFPLLVIFEIDKGREIALRLFPSAVGRNVIGKEEPVASPIHRVIICAHHDSKTQAIPIKLRGTVIVILFISMIYLMAGSFLHLITLFVLPEYAFFEDLIYIGILIMVLYHSFYLFLNILTRFVEPSPGAEDNAAAVGLSLELAKAIKSNPLWKTEVWFLFTDGEEIAMKGAHAFVKKYKSQLDGAWVLNLEGGGTEGPITYSTKEMSIMTAKSSEMLTKVLKDVAKQTIGVVEPMRQSTTTDGYVFSKNGLDAITIWRYKEEVREVVHTAADTIDRLDPEILDNTVDFLEEVLRYIDSS
ncbi:MAG: M28 family metallopeptidase [Candidatus Thorarchaeota archaeon]